MLRVCLCAQVLFAMLFIAGNAVAQGSPDDGHTLVPIAPCRLLDTANADAPPERGASRQVDLRASRCGRVVPSVATAYSLRVTRVSHTAPEKLPAGVGRVMETARKVPAPADGRLSFPMPANEYVAVDVVGYYVAPGSMRSSDGSTAIRSDSASSEGGPASNVVYDGSAGELYLNAAGGDPAGVFMRASSGSPSIAAKLGNATGAATFAISNSTADMMVFRSDGALQLKPNAFVDGRTDFFGTPGSYYGYVPIPTNTIHDVRLVNPMDANNTNVSRVVFFNAWTDDESGSPPVTKFRARTGGFYSQQENVNYDSSFHWHNPNQYHFRATSSVENKNTFWVKAATSYTSVEQTRADMYVSGRVGIGTPTPGPFLEVVGNDMNTAGSTVVISSGVGSGTAWSNQINVTNASGGYGLLLGFNGPGRTPLVYHNPNGAHLVNVQNGPLTLGTSNLPRVTVSGSGMVGIGTTAPNHALDVGGNMTIGSGYNSLSSVPLNGLLVEGGVGIGVPVANAKLHVGGNVLVSGNTTVTGNISAIGSITGGTVIGALYQDVAEWVPSSSDLPPGTVVILNREATNEVLPSSVSYDTAVAGVVSAQPGVILGVAGPEKEMIATMGRVRVRVDATGAPIFAGDLLVTSDKAGMAMKSRPVDIAGLPFHRPGTLIGKALESLASGEGEILVLLSLQ